MALPLRRILNIFLIFFLSILIVILIQPLLWTNTLNNFFEIIGTFANFERWDNQVFYLESFINLFIYRITIYL